MIEKAIKQAYLPEKTIELGRTVQRELDEIKARLDALDLDEIKQQLAKLCAKL